MIKQPIASKPALIALAIMAWTGVLLQYVLSIDLALDNGKTVIDGTVVFLGYFTVLTNIFVALTATMPILAGSRRLGQWFASPMVVGSATTAILLVGIAYHFLLRQVWQPQGLQLQADIVLHYVVPILTFAYWLVFPPQAKLTIFAPLLWCLYPLAYVVYAFVRGELLGIYPYYFIDVSSLGYGKAFLNALGLLIAFVVLGFVVRALATLRKHVGATEKPVGDE